MPFLPLNQQHQSTEGLSLSFLKHSVESVYSCFFCYSCTNRHICMDCLVDCDSYKVCKKSDYYCSHLSCRWHVHLTPNSVEAVKAHPQTPFHSPVGFFLVLPRIQTYRIRFDWVALTSVGPVSWTICIWYPMRAPRHNVPLIHLLILLYVYCSFVYLISKDKVVEAEWKYLDVN